jgi:hypothetical protein
MELSWSIIGSCFIKVNKETEIPVELFKAVIEEPTDVKAEDWPIFLYGRHLEPVRDLFKVTRGKRAERTKSR